MASSVLAKAAGVTPTERASSFLRIARKLAGHAQLRGSNARGAAAAPRSGWVITALSWVRLAFPARPRDAARSKIGQGSSS